MFFTVSTEEHCLEMAHLFWKSHVLVTMESNTGISSTKRDSLFYPSMNTTVLEPPSSFLLKQSNLFVWQIVYSRKFLIRADHIFCYDSCSLRSWRNNCFNGSNIFSSMILRLNEKNA